MIVGAFIVSVAAAYLLEEVYGFAGVSPERMLGAGIAGYVWGGILWAAASAPHQSRLLFTLRGNARLVSILFLAAGTAGFVAFALLQTE